MRSTPWIELIAFQYKKVDLAYGSGDKFVLTYLSNMSEEDEHEDKEDEPFSFDEDPCYEDFQPEVLSSESSYAASRHLALGVLAFGGLSLWG